MILAMSVDLFNALIGGGRRRPRASCPGSVVRERSTSAAIVRSNIRANASELPLRCAGFAAWLLLLPSP